MPAHPTTSRMTAREQKYAAASVRSSKRWPSIGRRDAENLGEPGQAEVSPQRRRQTLAHQHQREQASGHLAEHVKARVGRRLEPSEDLSGDRGVGDVQRLERRPGSGAGG